jgi:hypothetical protein
MLGFSPRGIASSHFAFFRKLSSRRGKAPQKMKLSDASAKKTPKLCRLIRFESAGWMCRRFRHEAGTPNIEERK